MTTQQHFMTTLNRIRECEPCKAGWKTLLSTLGKTKADDEPLALETILDSNGVDDALWCMRAITGHDRDFRLFAVWAARQVQHLMSDEQSLNALDVAEGFANGDVSKLELEAARAAASAAAWAAYSAAEGAAEGESAQEKRLRQMISDGGWVGSTQPDNKAGV